MQLGARVETVNTDPAPKKVVAPKRITLSIVPEQARKERRPTVRYVVALMGLAAAVTTCLVNVAISQNQYELVKLNNQLRAISQENQPLAEQVQYLESPQILHAKAAKLGMVQAATPGVINLDNSTSTMGEISTSEDKMGKLLLDAPEKPVVVGSKAKPLVAKTNPTNPVPEIVEETALVTPEVVPEAPKPAEKVNSGVNERPIFTGIDLNGGTIPAPVMKTPQN